MQQNTQRMITTALWSVLVVAMASVVVVGMWRRQPDTAAARVGDVRTDTPVEQGLPVLYDAPAFTLTDQDGQRFSSERLRGQVWVGALIFTNCPGVCPMMTQKLVKLQAAVPTADVKLVAFSVDPERDTPQVLKEYATQRGADASRWHLLTGSKAEIFRTAEGLKLSAAPATAETPIVHAEYFLLVDRKGRVRGAYDSKDDAKLNSLAQDAKALAAGT